MGGWVASKESLQAPPPFFPKATLSCLRLTTFFSALLHLKSLFAGYWQVRTFELKLALQIMPSIQLSCSYFEKKNYMVISYLKNQFLQLSSLLSYSLFPFFFLLLKVVKDSIIKDWNVQCTVKSGGCRAANISKSSHSFFVSWVYSLSTLINIHPLSLLSSSKRCCRYPPLQK